jgi:hypothetical protein
MSANPVSECPPPVSECPPPVSECPPPVSECPPQKYFGLVNKSLRFVILLFASGLKYRLAGEEDDATIVVKVGMLRYGVVHI